ncbi:hypothetical protein QN400_00410 [Pseudomonas sp. RTC3]|uniref:hypothetical protein n=1 Tax=unclassified Pseudomonas TaxID=196821 RepID=UPI002AB4AF65|nr:MULTISPECIES: hypothetical protein [unclassified Pseudomonas]MEB0060497.1 hypothetical protein [Pseudomonas sp. RTC3]MDY7568183.1 hypothetical protein [Pseudomonas sp. 5C2]MEB0005252.1 hypothetical protein [Pseudomonas sp. RTB2]MEB0015485.1 hypothetical protein [Pseudomonas sp. RTB3]MEB0024302.1 hypothetical protein [Pseudomonas sp. MH9.2]
MSTEIIREKARNLLNAALENWNLNPDAVYFNGVNNMTERLVIASISLTEEAVDKTLEKDLPTYSYVNGGLFSVAYSFADEHRVEGPDAETLSRIITEIVHTLA